MNTGVSIEISRNGFKVLKKNGRLLASAFDPLKEASDWAGGAARSRGARETLIVLGVGSGYHVAELARRRPGQEILAIDRDARVFELARRICPEMNENLVLIEPRIEHLIEHDRVRDAIGGLTRILKHGPSFQIERDYFRAAEAFFVGRDKTSFTAHLRARPELRSLLDPERIKQAPEDELISIKTLQGMFLPRAQNSHERRLWRVLEELVR